MNTTKHLLRTSVAAIAAPALLSPALGQEVDPSTAAPVQNESPVAVDAPPIVETPAPAADPLAPSEPAAEVTTTTGTSPATVTRRQSATLSPRSVNSTVAGEAEAPDEAGGLSTSAPIASPSVPVGVPTANSDIASETVPASLAPPAEGTNDDIVPVAAAAGAGLLALAGAGIAMRRRRRSVTDDVVVHEPRIERSINRQPDAVTRPAVSQAPIAPTVAVGGNRIERALRGPTPDNPFLSLKKRLKRAAFFEQRERQIRQGIGARVSPMAGLPRRLADGLATRMQPKPVQRFQWA